MEKFKVYTEEGLFDEEEQFVKVKVDLNLMRFLTFKICKYHIVTLYL